MISKNKVKTDDLDLPSDKNFGFLFVVIFFLLGLYGFKNDWYIPIVFLCFLLSFFLIPISIFYFKILAPLNKIWFLVGVYMAKIINPIVLGLIFFLILTPVALLGKLMGRDELKLNDVYGNKNTYWINRNSNQLNTETFKNQF